MKALILAAGYATRMYPLTLDKAKPLLEVAGRPTVEHIIEQICGIEEVSEILLVTNDKFFAQFQAWQKRFSAKRPVRIINDKSISETDRLGAVGDMDFVIRGEKIADDLLVIAGDNLFKTGLRQFIDFARDHSPASSIGLYNLRDKESVRKYSQVRLDGENKIIEFEEKPQHPTTTLVAKCVYFFPKAKLDLLSEYIKAGNSTDQPGHYISWLCRRDSVYGFIFSGKWYDIGNYEIYKQANEDWTLCAKKKEEK